MKTFATILAVAATLFLAVSVARADEATSKPWNLAGVTPVQVTLSNGGKVNRFAVRLTKSDSLPRTFVIGKARATKLLETVGTELENVEFKSAVAGLGAINTCATDWPQTRGKAVAELASAFIKAAQGENTQVEGTFGADLLEVIFIDKDEYAVVWPLLTSEMEKVGLKLALTDKAAFQVQALADSDAIYASLTDQGDNTALVRLSQGAIARDQGRESSSREVAAN